MEIKTKYVNMATKKQLCEQIVENSLVDNNGILSIDYINMRMGIDITLVQFYSDIDLSETDLDTLYENGTMDELKKSIPYSELNFIEENVNYMLDERKDVNNSLSSVINRNLSNLIAKIPDEKGIAKLMKKLPKALEKISPETLDILKGFNKGSIK
jgi:DNA primase